MIPVSSFNEKLDSQFKNAILIHKSHIDNMVGYYIVQKLCWLPAYQCYMIKYFSCILQRIGTLFFTEESIKELAENKYNNSKHECFYIIP